MTSSVITFHYFSVRLLRYYSVRLICRNIIVILISLFHFSFKLCKLSLLRSAMYVIDFVSTLCGEVPIQSKKKTLEQLPLISL